MGGSKRVQQARSQVVHSDVNTHNVITMRDPKRETFLKRKGWVVGAVIDFGDMLYTPLVHNVAIMCANQRRS